VRAALPLLLFAGLTACEQESKCGASSGTVVNVVDGDTVDLDDGTRLRLLLVDAPEITLGHDDCYGHEAAAYTTEQLLGQQVKLKYDDAECTDKYGRTLAYITVGNVDVNAELEKRGLACRLYIPPAGDARQDEFATYESEARTDKTGMWGVCTDIPCSK
jgi:micrococcal nuclease